MVAFQEISLDTGPLTDPRQVDDIARHFGKVTSTGESGLSFQASLLKLPEVTIGQATFGAIEIERSAEQNLPDDDDLIIWMMPRGASVLSPDGTVLGVQPGDFLLTSLGCNFRASVPASDGNAMVVFQISRRALGDVAGLSVKTVPGSLAASLPEMQLLLSYTANLTPALVNSAALGEMVAAQIVDLVRLALAPPSPVDQAQRSISAARLSAAQADISMHFDEAGLSAEQVAQRLGFSRRYLDMLFEKEGTTFSEYLNQTRLDVARSRLADPHNANLKIIDIAMECGFGDVSTFNRLFKRKYAMTPSQARTTQAD